MKVLVRTEEFHMKSSVKANGTVFYLFFHRLLTVLVLQIIAATMAIPLFTACCILIGVYDFHWSPEKESGKQSYEIYVYLYACAQSLS